MVTLIVVMLPMCFVTMALEFIMDIPNRIHARKEFAMFRKQRSIWPKGC